MAAYPSYNMLLGSSREEESGVEDDFTPAGTMHSRIFHSVSHYRFRLIHQLSLAEWKSLKSTYDAGKRAEYTLSYLVESPIVTYTVKFTAPPQIVGNLGLNRFYVEVSLYGTAD